MHDDKWPRYEIMIILSQSNKAQQNDGYILFYISYILDDNELKRSYWVHFKWWLELNGLGTF